MDAAAALFTTLHATCGMDPRAQPPGPETWGPDGNDAVALASPGPMALGELRAPREVGMRGQAGHAIKQDLAMASSRPGDRPSARRRSSSAVTWAESRIVQSLIRAGVEGGHRGSRSSRARGRSAARARRRRRPAQARRRGARPLCRRVRRRHRPRSAVSRRGSGGVRRGDGRPRAPPRLAARRRGACARRERAPYDRRRPGDSHHANEASTNATAPRSGGQGPSGSLDGRASRAADADQGTGV